MPKLPRWGVIWSIAAVVAIVALVAQTAPSPFYVLAPGGTYEIEPRLLVPAEQRHAMGRLAFTAVEARRGTWADVLTAQFDAAAEVVPADALRPGGISPDQMRQVNLALIEESKALAALVAVRAAGYAVEVTGQGAAVQAVLDDSPAAGTLRPGDIIVAVDDRPTMTAVDVVEAVRRRQVGEQVKLSLLRGDQPEHVVVGTRTSPSEPGRPIIGALVSTRFFEVDLPFPVEIDTENIGGASAGLMFSLGILDAITPGLLTRGYSVAGTGTIAADGTVGPIGGTALKLRAAERAGAEIFFVPRQNFEEVQPDARGIHVVPVDRFADALRYLCHLHPKPDAPPELPTPCMTPP